MYDVALFTLAANLVASGTVTVGYPTGRSKGSYSLNKGKHVLLAGSNKYVSPTDFSLTFNANASSITLTWGAGKPTLAAGTKLRLQLDRRGQDDGRPLDAGNVVKVGLAPTYTIDLGSPETADADGLTTVTAISASAAAPLNGALVSNGVGVFDAPRNVVAAWTGTAVLTVTGKDEYGNTVVESSASGTSLAGKKAFKTVTSAIPNAAVTSATIGSGDVLGLPVFLPSTAVILKELEDGAAASAGTAVAGVTSKATATTGDVRGTYDPNSACDGSKGFVLVASLPDPQEKGVPQFAG